MITQLMRLNNRGAMEQKTVVLFVLLGLFFVYVDYRFVFSSQLRGIKDAQSAAVETQQELDLLQASLPRLNELTNKEKQAQATISDFTMKFTAEDEIVRLLQRVSEIAESYRVTISEIKPSKQAVSPGAAKGGEGMPGQPLLITLSALCDYHSLAKFIADLEGMDIYIAVDSFKISPQQTDSLVQKVNLVLKTYVE